MPVAVIIPVRLRVDPDALSRRGAELEEALAAAAGRALASSRDVVLRERGGYLSVFVHPPRITWSGEGLAAVPTAVRAEIEERLARTLAEATHAAGLDAVVRRAAQAPHRTSYPTTRLVPAAYRHEAARRGLPQKGQGAIAAISVHLDRAVRLLGSASIPASARRRPAPGARRPPCPRTQARPRR